MLQTFGITSATGLINNIQVGEQRKICIIHMYCTSCIIVYLENIILSNHSTATFNKFLEIN